MSAFFLHELPRGYIFNPGWNFFQKADSLFSNYTNRVYHKNARFIHFTNHFICEFNELKFTHFRIQFLRLEFRWPLSFAEMCSVGLKVLENLVTRSVWPLRRISFNRFPVPARSRFFENFGSRFPPGSRYLNFLVPGSRPFPIFWKILVPGSRPVPAGTFPGRCPAS